MTRIGLGLGLLAGLGLAGTRPAAAQLLNGGFEKPDAGPVFTTYFAPVGPVGFDWSLDAGSIDHIGGYWQPAEGRQSVDLNGLNAATLSQKVGTSAGQLYNLDFQMAGNTDGGPVIKTMDVFWRGFLAGNFAFDTTGHSHGSMGWTPHHLFVTGSGGLDELKFVSTTGGYFPAFGPALDDVRLSPVDAPPVPEPTSLALLSGGALGLLRAGRRRRQKAQEASLLA